MNAIDRGVGLTESERYLAKLADASFLDLWSYPNTFNDRHHGDSQHGQEICDLLVVCADDVLIFSDKSICWPGGDDVHLAWSRWYRRAVKKSVDQVRGAERWLRRFPERVYIDPACTRRLPIDLPHADKMRVHGIAVALGAQKACAEHCQDPDGSLMMRSSLKGKMHTDQECADYHPFVFGDVDPDGPFVHVFDETALDCVLREMDTIQDFVGYLNARAIAIRKQRIAFAPNEADLLAVYLQTDVGEGKHGFPVDAQTDGESPSKIVIAGGLYATYSQSAKHYAKWHANQVSYAWDHLIRQFTAHVLAGTSVHVVGEAPQPALAERALRVMALEDRTSRRALGQAFVGAMQEAERLGRDRFARIVIPSAGSADPECGHVFLVLAYQDRWMEGRTYEDYRAARATLLRAYCEAALYENRSLKRMLGIAIDAAPSVTGREGSSEDLMLVEILSWTPEAEKETEQRRKRLDIMKAARLRRREISVTEYPPSGEPARMESGNRQERRAVRSKRRKSR